MNTLLHLAAVLSSLWASIFAFQTLNESALGGALLILFFGFIAMTIAALDDDLVIMGGKGFMGFRSPQREGITVPSKIALIVTIALLFFSTYNVTGAKTKDVAILSPHTAFGNVAVAELTPIIQLQFPYSVNPRLVNTETKGSGTSTISAALLTVSSGTTTDSHQHLTSLLAAKYHPGQGTLGRWTAIYQGTGTAGTLAWAGLGNNEDALGFGYVGTEFGAFHRQNGATETRTLTFTTGAVTAGGTITITLDGDATEVEIVNGDSIQSVARAVGAVTFAGWNTQVIGPDVVFISHTADVRAGAFTLVDTDTTGVEATGGLVQTITGVAPTDTLIAQADWNLDNLDGDGDSANPSGMELDITKGNVYEVQFQWLGFGAIIYAVENPANGRFIEVHEIMFANTNTAPSLQNPSLPLSIEVDNNGTTTDIIIKSSSMGAFTEGKVVDSLGLNNSAIGTASGDLTTETCFLAIKSKPVFQSQPNRVNFKPLLLTFSANGSGAAKFTTLRVVINPVLGGPVTFTDVQTATSIMSFSTNGTTVTGGGVIGSFEFGSDVSSFQVDLAAISTEQAPGTLACITAETDGGTTDVDAAVIWRELF